MSKKTLFYLHEFVIFKHNVYNKTCFLLTNSSKSSWVTLVNSFFCVKGVNNA